MLESKCYVHRQSPTFPHVASLNLGVQKSALEFLEPPDMGTDKQGVEEVPYSGVQMGGSGDTLQWIAWFCIGWASG